MGIAVIQTVNIRQEDQQLRSRCGGHHSGKGIIIAHGDLLRGNRVILVDDGQGPQLQQAVQGVVEVLLPAAAVGNVRRSDQKLGHRMIVFSKQLVIHIHQLALSHRRRCLLGGHIVGPLPEVQLTEAHGDGAGGHQNDLVTRVFQIAEHSAHPLHPLNIQPPGGIGQRGGPHLDYDSHRSFPFPSAALGFFRIQRRCQEASAPSSFLPILYQNAASVKASGPPFDNFYKKLYNKGKFVYTGVSDAGKG